MRISFERTGWRAGKADPSEFLRPSADPRRRLGARGGGGGGGNAEEGSKRKKLG